jgi:hypothetical protein
MSAPARAYVDRIFALPAMVDWGKGEKSQ